MERTTIDQTELVNTSILFRSDYEISSPTIDESEEMSKRDPASYNWYLVDGLNGSEEHTLSCLGSTWVGVLNQH
jgi:hypothetical protein